MHEDEACNVVQIRRLERRAKLADNCCLLELLAAFAVWQHCRSASTPTFWCPTFKQEWAVDLTQEKLADLCQWGTRVRHGASAAELW